jgi:hypothetical protein
MTTTRDLSKVATEELRAAYEPQAAKLRELRAQAKSLEATVEPLKLELAERENRATLILNAVMAGQQGLLRATGVSEDIIKAAEERFAQMKAVKVTAREQAVTGEAVSS